ncbi:HNH endonuclease, partial [Candidatus Bathyarchaeota archaeon]|nr:HNH endonuclease [Candidatus Bathyarchaeota archaeon]
RPPKRCRLINGEYVRFSMEFKSKASIKQKIKSCEKCGFADQRILVLHHTDGNHKNNSENNLIVLCPNCHALAHLKLLDARGLDSSSMPLPPHIGFRGKTR